MDIAVNVIKDMRKHIRVPLLQEVECQGEAGKFLSYMSDISVGGMFIENLTSYAPGSVITVRFRLPNSQEILVTSAEVCYVQKGIGAGVKFLDLKPEAAGKICELIEWVLKRWPIPRRSARLPVNIPVRIKGTEKSGKNFQEQATIITLSKNGACVQTNRDVEVGMLLLLHTPKGVVQARIVWVGAETTQTKGQVGIQCRGLAQALGYNLPW